MLRSASDDTQYTAWQEWPASNRQPLVLETSARPLELHSHIGTDGWFRSNVSESTAQHSPIELRQHEMVARERVERSVPGL